jgi:predicted PurR-regulated permease PerM
MWSILIFVLNYIPYLGSLLAIALPIALSFLHKEPGTALAVAIGLVGIQLALGNFVEPRMAGRRLGVSPLLILLSLSFWGLVWGIVGMILAVPLLVSIKIVLENIPATRPLATLMSNM